MSEEDSIKQSDYQALLKQYEALKLRASQFSYIEQQLIDARASIDYKYTTWKRFNNAIKAVMLCAEFEDCKQLIAEGVVDVFELELSAVFLINKKDLKIIDYAVEGKYWEPDKAHAIYRCLISFLENKTDETTHQLISEELDKFEETERMDCVLVRRFKDLYENFEFVILGAISNNNALLYKTITDSDLEMFDSYALQVSTIVSNRLKASKLDVQIKNLEQSKLELKKLSHIATATTSGVVITDKYGHVEWVNKSFIRNTGYTREDIIGKKPGHVLQRPGVDEAAKRSISKAVREHKTFEAKIINFKKNGEQFLNQVEITPVFNDDKELVNYISIQRNVTEEERFKNETLKINKRFKIITESANIGIWDWDIINKKPDANETFARIFGVHKLKNLELLELEVFFDQVVPEDRARMFELWQSLIHGERDLVETQFKIIRHDDGALRHIKTTALSEKDVSGKITRIMGSFFDDTETVEYQENLLQTNTELKKINHELDTFVYRVSHDLRTPLLSILGLVELLRIDHASDTSEEHMSMLNMIEANIKRLDTTIAEILEYSRNSRLEQKHQEFNFLRSVEDVIADLKHINPKVRFKINGANQSPIVVSDENRIKTVLKNLIGNAVKYHSDERDDPYVAIDYKNTNDQLEFTVEDNGNGIEPDQLPKIFDMFYRSSTKKQGTGLGLFICKEVVENLGGEIQVESIVDKMTIFNVTIPKPTTNEQ